MDKIGITVNIAGRIYPLKVSASEEEVLRKVAKQIEGMIKKYEESQNVKDKQDVLAMCALQLGTNAEINLGNYNKNIKETTEKINFLTALVEGQEMPL